MLAFTGKYGTGCLYLNNYVHGLESLLYLKLYSTMIFVNAGMGNTPLLEYGIVHAGIYWLIKDLPRVLSMSAFTG